MEKGNAKSTEEQTLDYFDLYDNPHQGRIIWVTLGSLLYRGAAYVVYLFSLVLSFVFEKNSIKNATDVPVETLSKDPVTIYVENEKKRFLAFLEKNQPIQSHGNVDEVLYDLDAYKRHVEDPDNELEKKWKRNILFESTPRGNIIMMYDPYKFGFSYYSNESSIHYSILNAVAMKYVRIFNCLDFFFDENESDYISPLIEIHRNNDKSTQVQRPSSNINVKSGPFAKFKNYKAPVVSTQQKNIASAASIAASEKPVPPKNKNKFIHGGKTINISFIIKKPKTYSSLFAGKSGYDDVFANANNLQKEVMSYSDFKKKINKTNE